LDKARRRKIMVDILTWSRTVLATTPNRWHDLTATLPPALLSLPPKAGEWSALQCLQHLVDTERMVFPKRVGYLLAGQDFPAFDPDSQGSAPVADQSPAALAAEFARLRTEAMAVLDTVTVADLSKHARHQELGVVTLSELIHEWAGHDLMHTVQAERALMQPFIQGCGPWLSYFADHVAR
jgi:hypothetical protein